MVVEATILTLVAQCGEAKLPTRTTPGTSKNAQNSIGITIYMSNKIYKACCRHLICSGVHIVIRPSKFRF